MGVEARQTNLSFTTYYLWASSQILSFLIQEE